MVDEGKEGDRGLSPRKIFWTTPLPCTRNAIFHKRRHKKGYFRSFVEEHRGLDPQVPSPS